MGAVLIAGAVVVGFALKEALGAYERRAGPSQGGPFHENHFMPETKVTLPETSPKQKPEPEPKGPDVPPPGLIGTVEQERRRKCEPIPVPHRGGSSAHNECADKVQNNSFPGWDVLVNGKRFDALQLATRTLWEVKTDDFDIHAPHSQRFFARVKLPEIKREQQIAESCGYRFVVGVRSAAHKTALLALDPDLTIVVMDWC
ncbi:MAG: DUF6310 domain-containing protein [Cystobacter sp.]